jgi:hypothetical protein
LGGGLYDMGLGWRYRDVLVGLWTWNGRLVVVMTYGIGVLVAVVMYGWAAAVTNQLFRGRWQTRLLWPLYPVIWMLWLCQFVRAYRELIRIEEGEDGE